MKVTPYERKGSLIRQMPLVTASDALALYKMFEREHDKWLKKLSAVRLLGFGKLKEIPANTEDLRQAAQCQIDL